MQQRFRSSLRIMLSRLLSICCAALLLCSCTKSDTVDRCAPVTTVAPSSEVANLQSALNAGGINAVGDPRGFFYVIVRTGDTTRRPTVCSTIKVSYTLRYLNGTQIEAGNNSSFPLNTLVLGWQEGLPLIGSGGAINLYLPPSLAYGATGTGGIPGNSNLLFQIDLVSVN